MPKLTYDILCRCCLTKNGLLRDKQVKQSYYILDVCKFCGEEFLGERKTSKFCDNTCKSSLHRVEVNCTYCSKKKEILPRKVSPNGIYFCGIICRNKWWCGRNNPSYRGGKVQITCKYCGKKKDIYPSHINEEGNFCNHECYDKWNAKEKIEVTCKYCGKKKEILPYKVNPKGIYFCNNTCRGKWGSLYNTGENSSNWQGGISADPYCLVFKDKGWRSIIKERDIDRFCWNPLCWGKGNCQTLHHINYDKKDCDLRNIITVCNSCNTRANGNREYWEAFYTELMRRRGYGN